MRALVLLKMGAEPVPAGVSTASPTRDTPLDDGEQDDYVTENAPEPLPVKCANDYGNDILSGIITC